LAAEDDRDEVTVSFAEDTESFEFPPVHCGEQDKHPRHLHRVDARLEETTKFIVGTTVWCNGEPRFNVVEHWSPPVTDPDSLAIGKALADSMGHMVEEVTARTKAQHCGSNDVHESHGHPTDSNLSCLGVSKSGVGLFVHHSVSGTAIPYLAPWPKQPHLFEPGVLDQFGWPHYFDPPIDGGDECQALLSVGSGVMCRSVQRDYYVHLPDPPVVHADAATEHIDPVTQGSHPRSLTDDLQPGNVITAVGNFEIQRPLTKDQLERARQAPGLMELNTPQSETGIFGVYGPDGRSLVEFRIIGGQLEAKYYPSDLGDGAKLFVEYLKTLVLED
jgi:hypothetical protein